MPAAFYDEVDNVPWMSLHNGGVTFFSAGFNPNNVAPFSWRKCNATESLSPRSSSEPPDLASQIAESLDSLSQELGGTEDSISEIATRLEVLEESCTVIRGHISTLRKVASQLQTSSQKKPRSYSSATGLTELATELGFLQVGQTVAAEAGLAELGLLQQDQG